MFKSVLFSNVFKRKLRSSRNHDIKNVAFIIRALLKSALKLTGKNRNEEAVDKIERALIQLNRLNKLTEETGNS